MQQLIQLLKELLYASPDRHIRGHSLALLKRLQELNPQDDD